MLPRPTCGALGSAQPRRDNLLDVALRLALGAGTLAAFPAARRAIPRSDWLAIARLGIVWMVGPFLLFSVALRSIDSSLAGMLNAAAPLFTAAIGAAMTRQLPDGRQRVGLLVGFAGVVALGLPKVLDAQATAVGVGLVVLATLSYGFAANFAAPLQKRYGALPVIWRAEIVAMLVLAPFALVAVPQSECAWSSAVALLALGFLCTAAGFVAFTSLIGRVGATRASVAIYFLPPVAIVLGAIVHGEVIAIASMFGTALVVAGAILVSRGRGRGLGLVNQERGPAKRAA